MADEERIARLAKHIGNLTRKDFHLTLSGDEISNLRRQGASELHSICADLVGSVNRFLSPSVLELAPPDYTPETFRDSGSTLFVITARDRIVQITFEGTRENFSTEKFRIPYILEGEVRSYNEEMLERTQIRSTALFYCLEETGNGWRYFDWHSGRTGAFNRQELVSLFEHLV